MKKQSDYGVIVTKPISVWSRDLNISPKSFLTNIAKATINGFKGDIDDCAENLLDSIADIKSEEKVGQIAWILIYQAIQNGTSELIKECLDLLNITSKMHVEIIEKKLEQSLQDTFETNLVITSEFFNQPEKLKIISQFSSLIENLCIEFGASQINSKAIASKLPNKFGVCLYRIWINSPEKFQLLVDVLGSPFSQKNNELLKWKIYHQSLHATLDKRVFKESFGLRDIYIKPRAYYTAPEIEDLSKVKGSKNKSIKHVVDLHDYLEDWILKQNTVDNLRLISGEPGSGKSSFSKVFASEIAASTGYCVLLIQLHYMDMTKDLDKAIQGYCDEYPSLRGIDVLASNKMVIVFDGLDEISMQGRVGETISNAFINNLKLKARVCSSVGRDVKFIVTGRDLAIQSCESIIKEAGKYLNLIPYYIIKDEYKFTTQNASDPNQLLDIDQRQLWWKKFSKLKGLEYENIPDNINTKELEPINSQPLLGYLLALSYLRGNINFNDSPNLNAIYQDLLESVFERQYASETGSSNQTHNSVERLTKNDFDVLMQEVALAVWHCNGTTATENYIYAHLKENELEHLLGNFTQDAENGVSNLLLSFYFRKLGQTVKGESTFEFTHKSFGEYLTSKKLVNLIIELTEAYTEKKLNHRKGKKFDDIILEWIKATGVSKFNSYFDSFVRNEFENLNLPQKELIQIIELIQNMLNHSVQNNFSLERLPNLTFDEMTTYSECVNIALVAFHSACSNLAYSNEDKIYTLELREDKSDRFEKWIYKNSHDMQFTEYLDYMDLAGLSLFGNNFVLGNLSWSSLYGSDLFNVFLSDSYLVGTDLSCCDIAQCDFENASLEHAEFHNSSIHNCKFYRANMEFSSFTDSRCKGANFSGVCLSSAKFNRAEFINSDFTDSDLRNADLTNAIFQNCNFKNAQLKGAILKGCNFKEVNLTGVNFKDVDLTGCLLPSDFDKNGSLSLPNTNENS